MAAFFFNKEIIFPRMVIARLYASFDLFLADKKCDLDFLYVINKLVRVVWPCPKNQKKYSRLWNFFIKLRFIDGIKFQMKYSFDSDHRSLNEKKLFSL